MLFRSGFVMSLTSYLRDRARLRVTLLRAEDRPGGLSPDWPALFAEIANIGRRSTFIKRAGLRARNKRAFTWHELASKKIDHSLAEGNAPIIESFMLKDLPRFREKSALQAFAVDSKGRIVVSNTLRNSHFPGPKLTRKA